MEIHIETEIDKEKKVMNPKQERNKILTMALAGQKINDLLEVSLILKEVFIVNYKDC